MGNPSPSRLSRFELESYRGQGHGAPAGKYLRYYCPIHGSDNQQSLSLDPDTGKFRCFACGAWGTLEDFREVRYASPTPPRPTPPPEPTGRPDLAPLLLSFRQALPESLGAKYLALRKIPLELAQKHGIGYAPPGRWPHPKRDWKWGRLVFSHTNPRGEVVNLYGRAVGPDDKTPKASRHDHLPGPKGIFNARALSAETVYLCEGAFDALSLIAAGRENACALFGIDGLRWEWITAKQIVFCLDQDAAGEHWRELAWEGVLRGFQVYWLPPETYAGHKDLSEAWAAGGEQWQTIGF